MFKTLPSFYYVVFRDKLGLAACRTFPLGLLGHPFQVADVVFKKDCVLENPWHFESDTNEFLSSSETTSNTPHARYFAQGSFCRLPLFKAIKLRAKGIVDVMDIHKHQWVLMDITAANEKDLLGSRV